MRAGSGERGAALSGPRASLLVHLQPRASRSEIAGWYGETIKIRVAAPPVEGAANEELVRFLAESRLRSGRASVSPVTRIVVGFDVFD